MILNDKKLLDCMIEMRESYSEKSFDFEFDIKINGSDVTANCNLDNSSLFCSFNYCRIYLLLCDLIEYTIFDNFELLNKVEMKEIADTLTRICLTEITHKEGFFEEDLIESTEYIRLIDTYDIYKKIDYMKYYESVICFVVENHQHFTEIDVGFSNFERNCQLYKLWKINKEI